VRACVNSAARQKTPKGKFVYIAMLLCRPENTRQRLLGLAEGINVFSSCSKRYYEEEIEEESWM